MLSTPSPFKLPLAGSYQTEKNQALLDFTTFRPEHFLVTNSFEKVNKVMILSLLV